MDVRDKCGSAGRADVGGFGEFGVALLAELVHCNRVQRMDSRSASLEGTNVVFDRIFMAG